MTAHLGSDAPELPEHLYRWLESGLLRVSREFDAALAQSPDQASTRAIATIGHRRLRILQLIPPAGIRQQALAARALVTKQAIADLIDNLAADGMVTRTPDPDDGRAWLVLRTPAGQRVSDAADAAMAEIERTLAHQVGEGPYSVFLSVLRELGAG
jgi:DNA-binding MarR family transcriptional regulator